MFLIDVNFCLCHFCVASIFFGFYDWNSMQNWYICLSCSSKGERFFLCMYDVTWTYSSRFHSLYFVNLNGILYRIRLVCTPLCICSSSTYHIIQGLLTRKSEIRDIFVGELQGNSWLRTVRREPNIYGIFYQMTGSPDIWLNKGMLHTVISEHLLRSL
jgi:hypothetical protein